MPLIEAAYQRTVLTKHETRREATRLLSEWVEEDPTRADRLAIEFTNSPNARFRWRVVSLTPIPSDAPDSHPAAGYLRQGQRDHFRDLYDYDY